jgi:hypothetical protein
MPRNVTCCEDGLLASLLFVLTWYTQPPSYLTVVAVSSKLQKTPISTSHTEPRILDHRRPASERTMGSNDSDNEVKNSQEYQTLSAHLSNGSKSLTSTLDSFCKPTEETFMNSQSASEVESQLWRVWKAITTIATQTAHDSPGRQKLAEFVLEVQKRPQVECKGEVCKIWDEAVVWKDLPILGPQMREAWNGGEAFSKPSSCYSSCKLTSTTYSCGRLLVFLRSQRLGKPKRFRRHSGRHTASQQQAISRVPQRLLALRHLDYPHGPRRHRKQPESGRGR